MNVFIHSGLNVNHVKRNWQ